MRGIFCGGRNRSTGPWPKPLLGHAPRITQPGLFIGSFWYLPNSALFRLNNHSRCCFAVSFPIQRSFSEAATPFVLLVSLPLSGVIHVKQLGDDWDISPGQSAVLFRPEFFALSARFAALIVGERHAQLGVRRGSSARRVEVPS
jgi:hypothetical protein